MAESRFDMEDGTVLVGRITELRTQEDYDILNKDRIATPKWVENRRKIENLEEELKKLEEFVKSLLDRIVELEHERSGWYE